ncbi:hypothetical protein [Rhizobium sp. 18065]|uniref:hypothetical protein n=1 Tax=Rhizobium sp. 18065 TaxID=2681411 RepID=UPI001FCE4A66|nr:hypothetical protein [Rhizobium sp. 18065]
MKRLTAASSSPALPARRRLERLPAAIALYSGLTILILSVLNLPGARDYVGIDNDDVMRLVQVRDLLAGQSWFDLMQYRLGLPGGTLMHWSRIIDLPIAALIKMFSLALPSERAEALALLVWPFFLVIPLMTAVAVAARRIGDTAVMHIALMLAAVFVVTGNRFLPGAIDHHNVQLVLVATIAACLLDPARRAGSFALAGFASALAIAIGAETTPLIAVVCVVVALLWALEGARSRTAARAFSLSLLLSISALFLATVPPEHYRLVTCDSLSIGYYAIIAAGAGALFVATLLPARLGLAGRSAALVTIGALVLLAALAVAPQCLQNPLNELDPLLQTMWLDGVLEAQSFLRWLEVEPASFGGFYAVPVFALAVCLFRVIRGDDVRSHAILLALLLISFVIALVQVRGAAFANLLAILPVALLIADLRHNSNAEPDNIGAGFFFVVVTLISVPSVWILSGVFIVEGTMGISNRMRSLVASGPASGTDAGAACETLQSLAQLNDLPAGTVVAPSDYGADILRITPHRVLSGPYHRNQGGMLTELHIGLAEPAEAAAFLRGSKSTILAFCPTNIQTEKIAKMKPDGLYAALEAGRVPDYLQPLPQDPQSGLTIYRVVLP